MEQDIIDEVDMVIAENLEQSQKLIVGIVCKTIARELLSFDLDMDQGLPRHPIAKKIYQIVDQQVQERLCTRH